MSRARFELALAHSTDGCFFQLSYRDIFWGAVAAAPHVFLGSTFAWDMSREN